MIRNLKKSFKSIMEKRLTIQDNSYDSDLEEANKSDILGPEAIMRGWVKFLTFYPSEE